MALTWRSLSFSSISTVTRDSKPKVQSSINPYSDASSHLKSLEQRRKKSVIYSALPETAASILVAATVVGAAATYLIKTTKASEETIAESSLRTCEDCGGSGICPECKGEGFVLKRLPDETAEKARLAAKNMATRYTAGLPKKWSYCTKCSSARSCRSCDGRGKL